MRLFQAALDTPRDSPFSATLSVHGLHFTVYTLSSFGPNFDANPRRLKVAEGGLKWLKVA